MRESLRAEQAIRSYFRVRGLGRPSKVYEITESGRELFPRKYDLILSLILQSIETAEGHEYTKKIMRSVADNMAQDILDKIKNSSAGLEDRPQMKWALCHHSTKKMILLIPS